jgi:tetratricopeptide (TPR) repeat protein
MGSPGPHRPQGAPSGGRRCAGCGSVLAADNTARLCSRCHREERDQLRAPPAHLRDGFFETDEFRAAFESQHIGKVFRAYRNHPRHLELFGKALNQELLGRWLGLTQAQVSKLENGKPEQNLEALRNYAKALSLPQRMLWFDFPGYSRLATTIVQRPGSLTVPGVPQTIVAAGDDLLADPSASRATVSRVDEEVADVPAGFDPDGRSRTTRPLVFGDTMGTEMADLALAMQPSGVSPALLEHVERTVAHIHGNFAKVPPTQLLPVVNEHLRWTTGRLKVSQTIAHRRQLCSIVGHLAGQRAWLMFDLRRVGEAESWYRIALDAAHEADEDSLSAWLLGGWSVIAFDVGRAREALTLLQRASQHADRTAHNPVAGWINALMARAHAADGDAVATRVMLTRIRERTWSIGEDTYRHGMDSRRGELNVDYYEGGSLLALGDNVAARHAFATALATQSDAHLKGRAVITLQVAMTHARENSLDQAADLAVSAWSIPPDQRIGPITERVQQLRDAIAPAGKSGALDQIDQLLGDESRLALP